MRVRCRVCAVRVNIEALHGSRAGAEAVGRQVLVEQTVPPDGGQRGLAHDQAEIAGRVGAMHEEQAGTVERRNEFRVVRARRNAGHVLSPRTYSP